MVGITDSRKILVGFDGSDESFDALTLAKLLADSEGGELHVAVVLWDDNPDLERERFDQLFSIARCELGDQSFVEQPLKEISAPKALHELAAELMPELLVLGSTHRSSIGRVLIGSVAERLLQGGPCAVAVAPGGYRDREHNGFSLIGVGYDGGREAKLALIMAERLAHQLRAQLKLIGVVPEGSPIGSYASAELHELRQPLINRYRRELAAAKDDLSGWVEAEATCIEGDPAATLADQGTQLDLLVVGSRGYGPVWATLLGAVSGKLVRTAECPVVVTPRVGDREAEADEGDAEPALQKAR